MRATDELTPRARVRPPWLLGLIASVMLLVLTLLLLEIGLRFIGYGDPDERYDPLNGFQGTQPVYSIVTRRTWVNDTYPDPTWTILQEFSR